MFVLGDSNVHYKDRLTYFGGADEPGEVCYNFSLKQPYSMLISNNLTQMVDLPTGIPECDSYSPALLDLFLLILVYALHCLPLSQFPLTFSQTECLVSSHSL